jgi:hypothetical protein
MFGIVAHHEQHNIGSQSHLGRPQDFPLRQRMIDDMTVRNFGPNTILCYLKQVSSLLSILASHRTA